MRAAIIILAITSAPALAQPAKLPDPTPPAVVEQSYSIYPTYALTSASGGVFLLEPIFRNNGAFSITSGKATRFADFTHHMVTAPAIWLGHVGPTGWGVRGRWFQLDADATQSYTAAAGETVRGITPLPAGQTALTGTAAASSNLAIRAADLQATYSIDCCRWSHLFGLGVRYTYIGQDYAATLAGSTSRIDLATHHHFDGWGPTGSIETKRQLGSGFALYGQAYLALLLGGTRESYTSTSNGAVTQASTQPTDFMPIGEFEVGVEYRRLVGNAQLFVQSGFHAQVWWGAGNATNIERLSFNSNTDSNLGLLGVALRAGVRY